MRAGDPLLVALLARCSFPPSGPVVCGLSGGADSLALVALAVAGGLDVTAIHVDHGLRPDSTDEAHTVAGLAGQLGVALVRRRVDVSAGANVEERARRARHDALGAGALLGHTADDRAETLLINLLRGAGTAGLSAMGPGPTRPILGLRRHETAALCAHLGLTPVIDPTNEDRRYVRNRIRHEVLPLLADVAGRDVVALLNRTADVVAADARALRQALDGLVTADARVLAALPEDVAAAAVRHWLLDAGERPDRDGVARVLAVARGRQRACELPGGHRVERHQQHLRIIAGHAVS